MEELKKMIKTILFYIVMIALLYGFYNGSIERLTKYNNYQITAICHAADIVEDTHGMYHCKSK